MNKEKINKISKLSGYSKEQVVAFFKKAWHTLSFNEKLSDYTEEDLFTFIITNYYE